MNHHLSKGFRLDFSLSTSEERFIDLQKNMTLLSLLSLTALFHLHISFPNVFGTTRSSVVGLMKCQEECNCNKGTV